MSCEVLGLLGFVFGLCFDLACLPVSVRREVSRLLLDF